MKMGAEKMAARLHSGAALRWLAATGVAAAAALLLALLHANSTTAGMVFLVLVVWSATLAGFALSLYMAALCAVALTTAFCRRCIRCGWLGRSSGCRCSPLPPVRWW